MDTPTRAQIEAAANTDRELWREHEGDYYADSIHVTKGGGIGMNVGGSVFVMPIRKWHALAAAQIGEPFSKERYDALPQYDPETIERCAQVAENYDMDGGLKDGLPKGWEGCRRMIAAAIRRLKEQS